MIVSTPLRVRSIPNNCSHLNRARSAYLIVNFTSIVEVHHRIIPFVIVEEKHNKTETFSETGVSSERRAKKEKRTPQIRFREKVVLGQMVTTQT